MASDTTSPIIDLTGLPIQGQIDAAAAMFKRARNNPDRVKVYIKSHIQTDFIYEWVLIDAEEWSLAQ